MLESVFIFVDTGSHTSGQLQFFLALIALAASNKKGISPYVLIFLSYLMVCYCLVVHADARDREERHLLFILVLVLVVDVHLNNISSINYSLDKLGAWDVILILVKHHLVALDVIADEVGRLCDAVKRLVCELWLSTVSSKANVRGVVQLVRVARLAIIVDLEVSDLRVKVSEHLGLHLIRTARRLLRHLPHRLHVWHLVNRLVNHLPATCLFLLIDLLLASEALGGGRADKLTLSTRRRRHLVEY